jgi:hypothetical protein
LKRLQDNENMGMEEMHAKRMKLERKHSRAAESSTSGEVGTVEV